MNDVWSLVTYEEVLFLAVHWYQVNREARHVLLIEGGHVL